MQDIRPPRSPQHQSKRPLGPVQPLKKPERDSLQTTPSPALSFEKPQAVSPLPRRSKKKTISVILFGVLIVLLIAVAAVFTWYKSQLSPVVNGNAESTRIVIDSGDGPALIAQKLKAKSLIKSSLAFEWYVRLNGKGQTLQAGTYTIAKNMDVPAIVEHISSGKEDVIRLTFLPGATVAQDKEVFYKAGYKKAAVDAAFAKRYDHPVFAGKPDSADLEGYIYGETYEFDASASPEDVLERTFDELYKTVQDNNLQAGFAKQGLTLYEGITLASIVQREIPDGDDQKVVAGVFYNRLKKNISLGSDVTYQYIADKTGRTRDPNLDSPYNTRRYKGLPPGPISAPGKSALVATAYPAKSEYLFFLSGDDDKTYFSKTQEGHEQNIKDHCQQKCQIL